MNRRITAPAPKAATELVLEGHRFRADKPVAIKTLTLFEKNENKPFHELQAETKTMPSAKKSNFLLPLLLSFLLSLVRNLIPLTRQQGKCLLHRRI